MDILDRTARKRWAASHAGKNDHHTALHNNAISQQQVTAVSKCNQIFSSDTNEGSYVLLVNVYPRGVKKDLSRSTRSSMIEAISF